MAAFTIGQVVRITSAPMAGAVGTVVFHDPDRDVWLVRIDATRQDYYAAADIEPYA